jgi:integrase
MSSLVGKDVKETKQFERIGDSLYRRNGLIYVRVRVDRKRTWRGTGTNHLATARKILREWRIQQVLKSQGIEPKVRVLERNRLTVTEVIDAYVKAGYPTRKMQTKAVSTVECEMYLLRPIRAFFVDRYAVTLRLDDGDKYRDWRNTGGYFIRRKRRDGSTRTCRTRGGDRGVDMELGALNNALNLAVRHGKLKSNPLEGCGRYRLAKDIRHCREVAPTPNGLQQIVFWMRARNEHAVADAVLFMAYSGLRIGEALPMHWEAVNWSDGLLHVTREKRGVMPWVPILLEMKTLLRDMQARAKSHLLFPSPFDVNRPRRAVPVRRRIAAACKGLGIAHVTPHGLRSYFVTQARQSGLTDAEVAMLIGDKTGPSIIALIYGDLRPDHLLKQAQRIRLGAISRNANANNSSIPVSIPCVPLVSEGLGGDLSEV